MNDSEPEKKDHTNPKYFWAAKFALKFDKAMRALAARPDDLKIVTFDQNPGKTHQIMQDWLKANQKLL